MNRNRLSDSQIAAIAEFEREFGRALFVPLGPRRERLMKWAGYGAVAIQSDPQWLDPSVLVIEVDGRAEVPS